MASLRIISFNWEVYNSTWNRTRYTCHSMFTIDTKYTHLIVINTKFVCYWAWWVCYANVVSINMRSHCVNVFRTCSVSRTGPRLLFCHTTTFGTQWNVNRDRFLNWILNCKTIFINCVHNGPARPFVRRCKFVCSPNAAAALVNPQDELRVRIFNSFFCFFNLLFQTNSHNQSHLMLKIHVSLVFLHLHLTLSFLSRKIAVDGYYPAIGSQHCSDRWTGKFKNTATDHTSYLSRAPRAAPV